MKKCVKLVISKNLYKTSKGPQWPIRKKKRRSKVPEYKLLQRIIVLKRQRK